MLLTNSYQCRPINEIVRHLLIDYRYTKFYFKHKFSAI